VRKAGRSTVLRFPALLLLLTAAVFREALRISAFSNDVIWRHLRIGTWVLQHHAIPRVGLYSQFSSSPWVDHSWPYEAFLALAYTIFGLRAIPLALMVFKIALAAVTFLLAGGRRRFWSAAILSALVQYVLVDLQPIPVLFSICFMGVTLYCLLESRRRRAIKPILWLPALFWLWANLDAQFLLGWAVLAIFLLAEGAERLLDRNGIWQCEAKQRVPFPQLIGIVSACVATVLLTPYSIRSIPSAYESVYSATLFKNFGYMAALTYRSPGPFVYLLLVLLACLALGRQKSRDLFKIMLMVAWAVPAFRIQSDDWTILLPAIAVLASGWKPATEDGAKPESASVRFYAPVIAGVIILLVVAYHRLPASSELETRLARVSPVKACEYIESHQTPGPIFNEYLWGGYVMWKMPEYPVSIDERITIYPSDIADRYFDVIMGKERMESLPSFAGARTILLPADYAITKALTTIPALQEQFREVYRDELAVVLVRR
jgi:hypothetical protein